MFGRKSDPLPPVVDHGELALKAAEAARESKKVEHFGKYLAALEKTLEPGSDVDYEYLAELMTAAGVNAADLSPHREALRHWNNAVKNCKGWANRYEGVKSIAAEAQREHDAIKAEYEKATAALHEARWDVTRCEHDKLGAMQIWNWNPVLRGDSTSLEKLFPDLKGRVAQ